MGRLCGRDARHCRRRRNFLAGVWFTAQQVVGELPRYADELRSLVPALDGPQVAGDDASQNADGGQQSAPGGIEQQAARSGGISKLLASFQGGIGSAVAGVLDTVSQYAEAIIEAVWRTVAIAVLIFFFTLLMLIEAPTWRSKIESVSSSVAEQATDESVEAIAQRFRWYLVVRTVLGIVTGALYAGWLWIFGVDFILVFGLLAFLLNYISILGSVIAGVNPDDLRFRHAGPRYGFARRG